jgi:hypothetical protein
VFIYFHIELAYDPPMADELYGIDDELPDWARDDVHDVPADEPADGEQDAAGDANAGQWHGEPPGVPERHDAAGLPLGVTLLSEGVARYYTQRVTAPPMVDCMFAALCTPLSYMGYGLPPTFVGALRDASGVPRLDHQNHPLGTSTADTRTALRKLLPDAPVVFGGLDDGSLLTRLGSGEIAVRVQVRAHDLPVHLRRFVGTHWVGQHAIAIGGATQIAGGRWQVRWMDPAGRPWSGYDGETVEYADVRPALMRTPSGGVRVTIGAKNAALPTVAAAQQKEDGVKLLTHAQVNEFAQIHQGTPFLHPETGEQVTQAGENADYRLAGRSPDGRFAGVWVNTTRVPNASGMTLLLVDVTRIGTPYIGT